MQNGRGLEFLYIALGVAALVATWAQVPAYLAHGFRDGQLAFWRDAVANPAGLFLTVDITFLAAGVMIWMFGECRRLGIAPKWAWGYLVGSLLVAISCFVPLFLAHRERALRSQPAAGAAPRGTDWFGVVFMLTGALLATAYSFTHLP